MTVTQNKNPTHRIYAVRKGEGESSRGYEPENKTADEEGGAQ
jgi:hypothetical protein